MAVTQSDVLLDSSTEKKKSFIQGTSRNINLYIEVNGNMKYLQSTPGLKLHQKGKKAKFNGGTVSAYGNMLFYVYDNELWVEDNGTSMRLLTLSPDNVSFCEIGVERPFMMVSDSNQLWAIDEQTFEVHACKLPNSPRDDKPAHPTSIATIAQRIVINDKDTGLFYYTRVNPLQNDTISQLQGSGSQLETVDVDSYEHLFEDIYGQVIFSGTSSSNDNVVAVTNVNDNLIVFGESSIEFWQPVQVGDTATGAEGLARNSYVGSRDIGLANAKQFQVVANKCFFVSTGKQATKDLYVIEGNDVKKVSTVDWDIGSISMTWSYRTPGHIFFGMCRDNDTLVYDLVTESFHTRQSRDSISGLLKQYMPAFFYSRDGKMWCLDSASTTIWQLDDNYFCEDIFSHNDIVTLPLFRSKETTVTSSNYVNFMCSGINVNMSTGLQEDYDDECELLLQVSNDGKTFSNRVESYLPPKGVYSYPVRFYNLGMFRTLVFRIVYTGNSYFCMDKLVMFHNMSNQII